MCPLIFLYCSTLILYNAASLLRKIYLGHNFICPLTNIKSAQRQYYISLLTNIKFAF